MRSTPTPPTAPAVSQAGGCLYVVATPIGNLADLSSRAAQVLQECDLVLAEDTRRVRKLLGHLGVSTPTRAFHEHNEERVQQYALARIAGGARLALVSDAGTPLLADPGFRLVRRCRELGLPVFAVPGPSAVVAALSVSGLPPLPFTFVGFLPAPAGARRRFLAQVAELSHTLVVFLSPHRLAMELRDCAAKLGENRPGALLAELTKLHERCLWGTLAELAVAPETAAPRGEYTLVVGPAPAGEVGEVSPELARRTVEEGLAQGLSLAEARRQAARALGVSRRQLYRWLLETP